MPAAGLCTRERGTVEETPRSVVGERGRIGREAIMFVLVLERSCEWAGIRKGVQTDKGLQG